MSDINLDFTVPNNSIQITVEPNDITFTPTDVQLTINTNVNSNSTPGGAYTQLQYNNGGSLGGIPNVTYTSGNLRLGATSNVKMTGGTNGYVLQTDGTGNLSWTAQTGGGGGNGAPGGSNTQIQYNDAGIFGGTAGFTFDNVSGNVDIPGNLSVIGNISGANIIGNVSVAEFVSNSTQSNITSLGALTNLSVVGYANIGSLRTYDDKVILGNGAGANSGITGQGVAIGYYAGYTNQGDDAIAIGDGAGQLDQGANSIAIGAGAGQIGQAANSIILNATGNPVNNNAADSFVVKPIRNANTGNALFYNSATGEITFDITNGNYSAFAGNVTGNAQPNITSLGLLTNVSVTGNVNASRLISNVATGTSPFVVSSNTVVANLNADLLDGYNTATLATANTIAVRGISGNLTANYYFGNGSQLTGVISSNANVANTLINGAELPNTYFNTTTLFVYPLANAVTSLGWSGGQYKELYANAVYSNAGNIVGNNITFKNSINSDITPSSASSTTPTHKIPIVLNGVTYYICLTSTI